MGEMKELLKHQSGARLLNINGFIYMQMTWRLQRVQCCSREGDRGQDGRMRRMSLPRSGASDISAQEHAACFHQQRV